MKPSCAPPVATPADRVRRTFGRHDGDVQPLLFEIALAERDIPRRSANHVRLRLAVPMGVVEPHEQMAALDPTRRKRIFCDNPARILKEIK